MPDKTPSITPDMTIAELMEKFPETEEVMLEYGLHCVGCAINEFDTIQGGAEIHGMSDDEIKGLIDDLNATLEKPRSYENKHVRVTERAILKLIELRREAGAEGDKVLVEFAENEDEGETKSSEAQGESQDPSSPQRRGSHGQREYFLELVEEKLPMHEEVPIGGIPFLFVREFLPELKGLLIDYKETFTEEGFTFRKTACCQDKA